MTRTRTLAVAFALLLLLQACEGALQGGPLPPLRDCGRGSSWSWQHGRCVGNLEFDRR
jgi:hypothetical protein